MTWYLGKLTYQRERRTQSVGPILIVRLQWNWVELPVTIKACCGGRRHELPIPLRLKVWWFDEKKAVARSQITWQQIPPTSYLYPLKLPTRKRRHINCDLVHLLTCYVCGEAYSTLHVQSYCTIYVCTSWPCKHTQGHNPVWNFSGIPQLTLWRLTSVADFMPRQHVYTLTWVFPCCVIDTHFPINTSRCVSTYTP